MPYNRCPGDPPEGTWIKKEDLIPFGWYVGTCRNAEIAQWVPTKDGHQFAYIRHKWADKFVETIPHPDDQVGMFDAFFPFQHIDTRAVYMKAVGLTK